MTDLVTITVKGLVQYYKLFISSLSARENPPTFDELQFTGILLQENERMKNYNKEANGLDLGLIARGRKPHR